MQVLRLGDGLGVFVQPSEQNGAGSDAQTAASTGSSGYGLADVDWSFQPFVAVAGGYRSVGWKVANVVDGVDPGAHEANFGW